MQIYIYAVGGCMGGRADGRADGRVGGWGGRRAGGRRAGGRAGEQADGRAGFQLAASGHLEREVPAAGAERSAIWWDAETTDAVVVAVEQWDAGPFQHVPHVHQVVVVAPEQQAACERTQVYQLIGYIRLTAGGLRAHASVSTDRVHTSNSRRPASARKCINWSGTYV